LIFKILRLQPDHTQVGEFSIFVLLILQISQIAQIIINLGINSPRLAAGKITRYSIFSPDLDYTESIADDGLIVNAQSWIGVCNNLKIL
jgi:hypothetical protein